MSEVVRVATDVMYVNLTLSGLDTHEIGYENVYLLVDGVLAYENGLPWDNDNPAVDEGRVITAEAYRLAQERLSEEQRARKEAQEAACARAVAEAKEKRRQQYEALRLEFGE